MPGKKSRGVSRRRQVIGRFNIMEILSFAYLSRIDVNYNHASLIEVTAPSRLKQICSSSGQDLAPVIVEMEEYK